MEINTTPTSPVSPKLTIDLKRVKDALQNGTHTFQILLNRYKGLPEIAVKTAMEDLKQQGIEIAPDVIEFIDKHFSRKPTRTPSADDNSVSAIYNRVKKVNSGEIGPDAYSPTITSRISISTKEIMNYLRLEQQGKNGIGKLFLKYPNIPMAAMSSAVKQLRDMEGMEVFAIVEKLEKQYEGQGFKGSLQLKPLSNDQILKGRQVWTSPQQTSPKF